MSRASSSLTTSNIPSNLLFVTNPSIDRKRTSNYEPDAAASHNMTSSETTDNRRIYQDGAQHNEFIKSVFHGGQTFNYGA